MPLLVSWALQTVSLVEPEMQYITDLELMSMPLAWSALCLCLLSADVSFQSGPICRAGAARYLLFKRSQHVPDAFAQSG